MNRSGSIAALGAVAAVLTLALENAHARKFQMSGSWAMRRGQVFLPLQFAATAMGAHTSQGNLSKGFGAPNGAVAGSGGVSATGSGPATLRVPGHRFGGTFSAKVPLPGPSLIQLTTMLSADGPAEAATLAPGAGPGSFSWCPGDPACAVGGGMLSTDPPQGKSPRNGRIVYRAGANRFGGVLQMLLRGRASISVLYRWTPPFQAIHPAFGGFSGLTRSQVQPTGASYAATNRVSLRRPIISQPTLPPTSSGLILHPGYLVCFPSAPCYASVTLLTTPMGRKIATVTTHTGFPFTTGTVFAQQTTGSGGDDFFTAMGADLRTALGAGNIAVVAGGMSYRRRSFRTASYASFGRVEMTLAPPIPSLSPAGFAAGAALLALAAGYATRRRWRVV